MKGDRVVVGDGYHWSLEDKQKTMAYMPQLDNQGQPMKTPDGGHVVQSVGGVVVGSTGFINGPVINVHRSYVHETMHRSTAMGGNDFIQLVRVFLDAYQREAYFPVDYIRIYGGQQ